MLPSSTKLVWKIEVYNERKLETTKVKQQSILCLYTRALRMKSSKQEHCKKGRL